MGNVKHKFKSPGCEAQEYKTTIIWKTAYILVLNMLKRCTQQYLQWNERIDWILYIKIKTPLTRNCMFLTAFFVLFLLINFFSMLVRCMSPWPAPPTSWSRSTAPSTSSYTASSGRSSRGSSSRPCVWWLVEATTPRLR